jgi:hypothetical protein
MHSTLQPSIQRIKHPIFKIQKHSSIPAAQPRVTARESPLDRKPPLARSAQGAAYTAAGRSRFARTGLPCGRSAIAVLGIGSIRSHGVNLHFRAFQGSSASSSIPACSRRGVDRATHSQSFRRSRGNRSAAVRQRVSGRRLAFRGIVHGRDRHRKRDATRCNRFGCGGVPTSDSNGDHGVSSACSFAASSLALHLLSLAFL